MPTICKICCEGDLIVIFTELDIVHGAISPVESELVGNRELWWHVLLAKSGILFCSCHCRCHPLLNRRWLRKQLLKQLLIYMSSAPLASRQGELFWSR